MQSGITISRTRPQAGFTLLELLLVLLIAGALAAVMAPRFEQLLSAVRFDHNSRAVQNLLQQSALKAQREGRVVQLEFDNEGIREGDTRLLTLEADSELIVLNRHYEHLDDPQLRFFSDGSSSGGHLLLKQQQREHRYHIHWLTGVVIHERTP